MGVYIFVEFFRCVFDRVILPITKSEQLFTTISIYRLSIENGTEPFRNVKLRAFGILIAFLIMYIHRHRIHMVPMSMTDNLIFGSIFNHINNYKYYAPVKISADGASIAPCE